MLIVVDDEAVDRGLQVDDGSKTPRLSLRFVQGREEALDRVEPGRRRRRGNGRPSRMTFEPSPNIWMLVGGVVVDDGVDCLARGYLLLDDIGKRMSS